MRGLKVSTEMSWCISDILVGFIRDAQEGAGNDRQGEALLGQDVGAQPRYTVRTDKNKCIFHVLVLKENCGSPARCHV